MKGAHSGRLETAPHFRDRTGYIWAAKIPRYYSVQTIWAESAIKAIHELNMEADLKHFNLPKLVAISFLYNRHIMPLIYAETNKLIKSKLRQPVFYFQVLMYLIDRMLFIAKNRLISRLSEPGLIQITDVVDIAAATRIFMGKLKEEKVVLLSEKLQPVQ
jgi:hypothetical protein